MAIEWNENLVTGNQGIDNQHRELFRRFDLLLEACNHKKGKEEVYHLLLFLSDYVKTHFAMEEDLQTKCNFPNYQAHKEQHHAFIRDFEQLEKQLKEEGTTLLLVIQTNQRIVKWLINHINVMDKELAAFIRAGV
jgi:hemerythrin